ncbi:hypothetical protein CDD83_3015 [Cordyceps sp. RAO-2017]|nr:hypothetical protein CDD83_3015 [Cordyceps sp. RAO-2017]
MKDLLLLQALAGGVIAAQQMTLPVVNHAAVVNALNPSDSGYKVCAMANKKLQDCASQAGGLESMSTAAPDAVAKCACCEGNRAVGASYSSCSSYLAQEVPSMSAQYSAFGNLYSICEANGRVCTGGGPSLTGKPASATGAPAPTGTVSESLGSLAPACNSMVGLFESCSSNIQGFTDLPLGEQAPCYCCLTARGKAVWTDEFDKYAQTCRDWAKGGGPQTVYSLASTLAGFCKKFTNACAASSTLPTTEATATSSPSTEAETTTQADSTGANANQASRTTSTRAPTATGAAASHLRVGSSAAAGLVAALAAMAMVI